MIPEIRMVNLTSVSGNLIVKIIKDSKIHKTKQANNCKELLWNVILRS